MQANKDNKTAIIALIIFAVFMLLILSGSNSSQSSQTTKSTASQPKQAEQTVQTDSAAQVPTSTVTPTPEPTPTPVPASSSTSVETQTSKASPDKVNTTSAATSEKNESQTISSALTSSSNQSALTEEETKYIESYIEISQNLVKDQRIISDLMINSSLDIINNTGGKKDQLLKASSDILGLLWQTEALTPPSSLSQIHTQFLSGLRDIDIAQDHLLKSFDEISVDEVEIYQNLNTQGSTKIKKANDTLLEWLNKKGMSM